MLRYPVIYDILCIISKEYINQYKIHCTQQVGETFQSWNFSARKTWLQYLALFTDNDRAVSEDYPQYKTYKFDLYEVFDGNPLHMPL